METVSGLELTMTASYAALLQRVAGVDAGVVELYALADAVGAAAEHHDGGVLLAPDLVLLLVGGVVVGRAGRELTGAGVDGLVGRRDAEGPPDAPSRPRPKSPRPWRWSRR